ncbi:hypothetical protein ABTX81_30265 [Kitasatospora sp. NPDC097605]|uniref:hypothetical protein n=1 Tax=Kitasatospora sp. NPDC097605 TaxID=3157226 RepID=UPI00331AF554
MPNPVVDPAALAAVITMIRTLPADHELDPGRGDVADRLETLIATKALTTDPADRARAAFETYTANRAGLAYDGQPIPDWDAVPDGIREAWTAAATRAATFTTDADTEHPATLAGGHALVLEHHDSDINATCQCGRPLGSAPVSRCADTHVDAWERHILAQH